MRPPPVSPRIRILDSSRTDERTAVRTFEAHRSRLEGLAYRMLGSVADAQDVVQEVWLRWAVTDQTAVAEPRAWLTKVCSRLCLDHLKSARVQREVYPGPWLPEPLVVDRAVWDGEDAPNDPAARLELDESVSFALLTAMERLSPAERAALLLHDVFDHDYAEIAATLGRTATACRQLVSRARRRVGDDRKKATPSVSAREHRELLQQFLTAAASADFTGLKAVLRDDATFHSDGGGKAIAARKVLVGADRIAKFFRGLVKTHGARYTPDSLRWCWFNGAPGVIVLERRQPVTAFCIRVVGGRIGTLYALRNPDKLAAFERR